MAADSVNALFNALEAISRPIDRYMWLRDLYDRQPSQYHSLLLAHTAAILPYIYTPTVGEACVHYHKLPLKSHGLFITAADTGGGIMRKLRAWHRQNISVVVVTDGERILGLGDLGANGMGISEGKATLYSAAAGVNPSCVLPVCMDVGTNREALRNDPYYRGVRKPRLRGAAYDALMDEFVAALAAWRPHVLIQFEDFGNSNAFRLLERYRRRICCFNDDIQGTAATCLAVVLSALHGSGRRLNEQRTLFLGAGEAGTGIGQLMALYMLRESQRDAAVVAAAGLQADTTGQGMATASGSTITTLKDAQRRCFFLDSKGLVCASRHGLEHHKVPFAHDVPYQPDLKSAIRALRPTILVGVSTIGGAFDEEVIKLMCSISARPLVLPLSNPTINSECTFEEAHRWSGGRVVFASGSPYPPLTTASGHVLSATQANNAYIFPAVGHAAMLTRSSIITDEVFLVAAETLGAMSTSQDVQASRLFPPFQHIRAVSARIMANVMQHIISNGLGVRPAGVKDHDLEAYAAARMWGGQPQLLPPRREQTNQPLPVSRL